MDVIETSMAHEEEDLSLMDEDLPDIDFDDLEETRAPVPSLDDDLMDIDLDEDISYDIEKDKSRTDIIREGDVALSVDYSLKYSRLGALFRIIPLYYIGMIPHFIVFIIYTVLSMILGFFNHIVVLSTGDSEEDSYSG